jgi:hypothetical protein
VKVCRKAYSFVEILVTFVFMTICKFGLCLFASLIALIPTQSCSKTTTINGELTYAATETPKIITAGQPIIAKVRLQYQTTSVQINFKGFQTKEMPTHHYSITAPAKITTNGQASSNAAYWWMDTTYTIHTVNPGQYILNFVYSNDIVKSDTVLVQ